MYTKKGISPVVATLLTMIIILVAFVIFSGFAKGTFLQEKALFNKQQEATGEIPCTRSPTVQLMEDVEGAVYIDPPKGIEGSPQEANVSLKAKMSSSCLEDLAVVWNFGNGKIEEHNCTYDAITGKGYVILNETTNEPTSKDCSSTNYTYTLSLSDVWTLKDIRLQVFGLRSAFYSEASTSGFVRDPNFAVWFANPPDTSEYSCVELDAQATNSKFIASFSKEETISGIRLDVSDSKRLRSIDSRSDYSIEDANLTYRAPVIRDEFAPSKEHAVRVMATKGYQTVTSDSVTYVRPGIKPANKEIIVYGEKGDLEVLYNSTSMQEPCSYTSWDLACPFQCVMDSEGLSCGAKDFPNLDGTNAHDVAITSGDVDLDGEDEIITLMKGDGDKKGYIFVFKNSEFERTKDFDSISLDELKDQWASIETSDESWVDIAVGNNIKFGNRVIEKGIIVLSQTSLALYEYKGGSINLINDGTDLPARKTLGVDTNGGWLGVTTADMDNDGEDEIIALGGNKLFAFKYADRAGLKKDNYLAPTESKSWDGVAAGDFDGGGKKNDVVIISGGGGLGDIAWFENISINADKSLSYSMIELKKSFPNVGWRDITAADIDRDGIDELITVDENDNNDEVCIFEWSALNAITDDEWDTINNGLTKLKNKVNPICKTITRSGDSWKWTSITTGDVGCFL